MLSKFLCQDTERFLKLLKVTEFNLKFGDMVMCGPKRNRISNRLL